MLDIDIGKTLGAFRLDFQVSVPDVGLVALFGRSGTGKTSVVSAIAGLLRPDRGHIRVGERTLYDAGQGVDLPPHRRSVGYVFQDARLFPHLSVRNNLLYGYHRADPAERRIDPGRVIGLLGIGELLERRPQRLSGGEKQRVAIGRALLAQPRVLLMDEPLASLDEPRKREILPYIERLRDELRIPIVYVSHALSEVLRLANHMAIVEAGRVVAAGSPKALSQRLELQELMGSAEAGAVIEAEVRSHDPHYDLSWLRFPGGMLRVPGIGRPAGTSVRVHVHARDVALAIERPQGLSIQNILEGRVSQVDEQPGPHAMVKLDVGETPLLARVTRESVHRLGLHPGRRVFVLVKSVALAPDAWSAMPQEGRTLQQ